MFNVIIGVVAQTCLVVVPMYLVLEQTLPMVITIAITVVCVVILKKNWWNKLSDH